MTVAAVIEQDGRFLFVEEMSSGRPVLNQPAGHVEPHERLADAVMRETLEETGYAFIPEALVGIYYWAAPGRNVTYLRFAFTGRAGSHDPQRALDHGIVRTLWLTPAEFAAQSARHRSPLVGRGVADWLAGTRFPLSLLTDFHR